MSNPVFLPTAPESGLIQSKGFSSLLEGFGRCQNAANMQLLDLLDAHRVSNAGDWRSRAGDRKSTRLNSSHRT